MAFIVKNDVDWRQFKFKLSSLFVVVQFLLSQINITAMSAENAMAHAYVSLADFKLHFSTEMIIKLNNHFTQMVKGNDGVSFVGAEDDIWYPKFVEMLFTKVVGKEGAKSFIVTGSVSQNLKCVSEEEQGDADVMLLSKFPRMTQEFQETALVPCDDPGFYKIMQLGAKQYPFVKRDGIKFLSAASLRNFEAVWFSRNLQLPLVVVESFDHEFEKAGRHNVASVLSWRASTDDSKFTRLKELPHQNIQYFYRLCRSYEQHILPILHGNAKSYAEQIIEVIMTISNVSVLYGGSRAKSGYESLSKLDSAFDNGLVPAALGFFRELEKQPNTYIDETDAFCLLEVSKQFETVIAEEMAIEEGTFSGKAQTLRGAFDLVPAISCDKFPQIARNWPSRVAGRAWPHQELVAKILEAGYHLVPKPSKNPKSDPSTTFRISFHEAEKILAQNLTQFQRECFRIFKMYFYEKLKREPKVVTTYHLKTVFFWLLEETEPGLWIEQNRAYCSMLLLQSLASSLRSMTLRHYFITENNLFNYLDKDRAKDVLEDLEKILADPVAASGPVIEKIKEFYSKKKESALGIVRSSDLDRFFIKSEVLFKKAVNSIQSPELHKKLNWNDEMTKKLEEILQDRSKQHILQFMFDLSYSRMVQGQFHSNFARNAPLPSGIAMLVQRFLPVSNEIMMKVLLPQIPDEARIKKQVNEIEVVLSTASLLEYEELLNLALLKSSFSAKSDDRLESILNGIMHLTGFHDEL